jgi:hypothetical protein
LLGLKTDKLKEAMETISWQNTKEELMKSSNKIELNSFLFKIAISFALR